MLPRANLRVVPVAIVSAVTALLISGFVPNGDADARRRRPPDPCENHQNTREMRRLQAEVAQLQTDLAAYQGAYQSLTDGMERVEKMVNRRVADERVRTTLVNAIGRAREVSGRWFVAAAPAAPVVAPPPVYTEPPPVYTEPPPVYYDDANTPQAMTPQQFRGLLRRVAKASFADDRLTLVRSAAQHNLFTVAQVIDLMKACDFEKTKLEIAELLYSRVVDVNIWHKVYGALDFKASRDQLRRRTEGGRRQR